MKKILLTFFAALVIFCGCNKSNQFKVTLNLDNANNQTVYLCKTVDGKNVCVDSAVFVGQKAVLTAPNDDPQVTYFIKFDKEEQCEVFRFFTENQNTTITGDREARESWVVKGCPVMDEYNAYRESLLPMERQMRELFDEGQEAVFSGDSVRGYEILEQVHTMMDEYNNKRFDYFRNHGDSYLVHSMLDQEKEEMELEEVKEIASHFTTESMYSKSVDEYIALYERVQIGHPFMDFTLQTKDGIDVNLAETIKNNKVTLIDFWASWCGPCREENPFVKAAYEEYHAKGLEIIGISLDRNEAEWLMAVKEDGLPYIQVRDIDKKASGDYLVRYIPSNYLFDQNGLIIARNLRGEELEAKLAEVLE